MNIKNRKTLNTLKKMQSLAGTDLTLGKLLYAIRKSDEKTQVEFANLLNVSKQYLCDLERGRRFVSPKVAAEYAKKLDYSMRQFVRLCLQDMINRDGLPLSVDVKAA